MSTDTFFFNMKMNNTNIILFYQYQPNLIDYNTSFYPFKNFRKTMYYICTTEYFLFGYTCLYIYICNTPWTKSYIKAYADIVTQLFMLDDICLVINNQNKYLMNVFETSIKHIAFI